MSDIPATEAQSTVTFVGDNHAPIISFDEAPFFGSLDGIGSITIAAQVLARRNQDGSIPSEHIITAHLRGSFRAMAALRNTIDRMLRAATPPTSGMQ